MKLLIISISLAGSLLLTVIIGRLHLAIRFAKDVKKLFSLSKDISKKIFYYEQLIGLPEPVQRYFKHVLKEGQPYISYVSLIHDGKFKTGLDSGWINIRGEQYFTTEHPGFIWKGATAIFTARDMFLADTGRLVVSIFSVYKAVDGHGIKFNEGELQRWLAESVWFPTNLLPAEKLFWTAIDSMTAKLSFWYKEVIITFIVRFNDADEIATMETQRYMGEESRNKWIVTLSDYKELNGVFVPTKCEAMWKLEKGDYPYARFNVKELVYNAPMLLKN